MKRISKKFMSLFLILALLVSTFLPGAGVVAAGESDTGAASYAVKIDPVEHGKVGAEKKAYQPGETVLLEVQPDEGCRLTSLKASVQGGPDLELEEKKDGFQFEMPEGDVQVSAYMEPEQEVETQQSEPEKIGCSEETEAKETEKETEARISETEQGTEAKQPETAKETESEKPAREAETEEGMEIKKAARAVDRDYLDIQEDGQSIFKCGQVTKIAGSTVMPADYTFYMRSRAGSGTAGYGNEVKPSPDKDHADDHTRYAALKEAYKGTGKISCFYDSVGIYNGQWVDLKLTAVDWKETDNAERGYGILTFGTSKPEVFVNDTKWVEMKFEFFVHGTQTPISVKGYTTFQDIDSRQGIVFKGGFNNQALYARPACELEHTNLNNGYLYVFTSQSGGIQSDPDAARKVTALFSGSTAGLIYTFGKSGNGGMGNQSKKLLPSPPSIQKRVSDNDEKMVIEDTLNQSPEPRKETFTYTITSQLLPEDTNTFYSLYQIRDEIDKGLAVNQGAITITDEYGNGAKSNFDIAIDANNALTITAKASALANTAFYGRTYSFNIPVNIKNTTVLNKAPYWEAANNRAKIPNKATLKTSLGDFESNFVYTYVPLYNMPQGWLTIHKTEDGTGAPLSGVTFQVYEWNGTAYNTMPYDTLSDGIVKGTYQNTKPYVYTSTNQGKFKVVETQSAADHFNEGWSQEIQFDGTEAKKLTYSVSNVKMNPKIAVTKLADRTTLGEDEKVPGWYKYDEKITFAIVAKNTGDVPVKNMVVTDTMSEELRKAVNVESAAFVVPETATTSKGAEVHITQNSASQVTLDTLQPEDSVLLTFAVSVGSRDQVKGLENLINLENVVKVTAAYHNGHQDAAVPEDEDDTDQDKVNVYNPLISITKLADRTAVKADGNKAGGWYDYEDAVTYTMKVRNYGNVPVSDLTILDTLSEELVDAVEAEEAAFVVERENAATEKGNPVQITKDPENGKKLTIDLLSPGDSVTLTFTAEVKPRTDLKGFAPEKLEQLDNQVRVSGKFDTGEAEPEQVPPDEDDQDNDKVNIYNPLISITKLADKTVIEEKENGEGGMETVKTGGWYHYEDTVTYTMTASNNGNVPVNNLTVEDTLSEELAAAVYAEDAGFVLEAVEPETPAEPGHPGENEEAKAAARAAAEEESENTEETQDTEGAEKPELTVTAATEKGNPVRITKDPESGKKLILDTLAPGDSVILTFKAKVRPREELKDFDLAKLEKLGNRVKLTGEYDNGDPEPARVTEDEDDTAEDDINIYNPLISVTKQADKTTVTGEGEKKPGQYDFEETITYAILVHNYGNAPATELILEDTLSEELEKAIDVTTASFVEGTLVSKNGREVKAAKESNTRLTLDRLEAGDSVTVTFQAKLKSREDLKDYDSVQLAKLNNHVAVTGKYDGDKIITKDGDDDDDETIDIRNPKLSVIKAADKTAGITVNDGTYTGEKKPGMYDFGDKVTYDIIIKNTGNVELFDIHAQDGMSRKLRKIIESGVFEIGKTVKTSLGNEVSVSGNGGETAVVSRLLPGESVTLKFAATLKKDGIRHFEDIKNAVTVSGSYDPDSPKPVPKDEDDTDRDTFDLSYGYVEITKISSSTKKALAGAEFEIYRKDGTLVGTVKTDSKGIAKSRELGLGEYYLKETKAPSGYKLSEKKAPFKITKHKEVMKKKIENTPYTEKAGSGEEEKISSNTPNTPVKTGDPTDSGMYLLLFISALILFVKLGRKVS